MSSPVQKSEAAPESEAPQGPNLTLMYILLALAILGAVAFALFIVRPFYLRH